MVKLVNMCTGAHTMHTLCKLVYRCKNKVVIFYDTRASLWPDFPGGRE